MASLQNELPPKGRDPAFYKTNQFGPSSQATAPARNGHNSSVAAKPVNIQLRKNRRPEPFAGTTSK
jgi:hypothetical protein